MIIIKSLAGCILDLEPEMVLLKYDRKGYSTILLIDKYSFINFLYEPSTYIKLCYIITI